MKIETAKELFTTVEHWLSFNELADQRNAIYSGFYQQATERIRKRFKKYPARGWNFEPWGAENQDTKWYLEEFGPNTLFVCYAWEYELQLRLHDLQAMDTTAITNALESDDYRELKNAFQRIDRFMEPKSKLMERRNFEFGIPHDGNLSPRELAWAAGCKTEEFVDQAVAKIECFVRNETVTSQIRELNLIGQGKK